MTCFWLMWIVDGKCVHRSQDKLVQLEQINSLIIYWALNLHSLEVQCGDVLVHKPKALEVCHHPLVQDKPVCTGWCSPPHSLHRTIQKYRQDQLGQQQLLNRVRVALVRTPAIPILQCLASLKVDPTELSLHIRLRQRGICPNEGFQLLAQMWSYITAYKSTCGSLVLVFVFGSKSLLTISWSSSQVTLPFRLLTVSWCF